MFAVLVLFSAVAVAGVVNPGLLGVETDEGFTSDGVGGEGSTSDGVGGEGSTSDGVGGESSTSDGVGGESTSGAEQGSLRTVDGITTQTLKLAPNFAAKAQPAAGLSSAQIIPAGLVRLDSSSKAIAFRTDRSATIAVRLVSSQTGETEEWVEIATATDEAPDGLTRGEEGYRETGLSTQPTGDENPAVGPLWAGESYDSVEVAVIAGDPGEVDIIGIDPGPDPDPEQQESSDQQEQASDIPAGPHIDSRLFLAPGRPTIAGRSEWTSKSWAYHNHGCTNGPSLARNVHAMVLHHTVTSNSYSSYEADDYIRSIYRLHAEINGWCDVGYNFIVDRFGKIWEARSSSLSGAVIGGHARGFNNSTMGVALLGQHHPGAYPTAATVSGAASESLSKLAHWVLGAYGVDPKGKTWLYNRSDSSTQRLAGKSWHYLPTVLGHRDLGLTSCPGDHGYSVSRALPAVLDSRRDRSIPIKLSAYTPKNHGPGFLTVTGSGAVRPGGSASPVYLSKLDSARRVIAIDGGHAGGYVLFDDGSLGNYGSAPQLDGTKVAGAVDLIVDPSLSKGWVLSVDGVLHGFGGLSDLKPRGAKISNAVAAAVIVGDTGPSGYVLTRAGKLRPFGSSRVVSLNKPFQGRAVDVVLTGPTSGWVLNSEGNVYGIGESESAASVTGGGSAVAVVASPNESGGWVVDSSGQLWPFLGARKILPISTDSGRPNIVDAAQVGYLLTDEFLASDDATYVLAVYRLFAGRRPSDIELEHFVASMEGKSDRVKLLAPLARSEHWAGSSIDKMYLDVLGRKPDDAGRRYWVEKIRGGLRYEDLGTYFYGSSEYAQAAGSHRAYVRVLYRALLRRRADSEGLVYWAGLLESGRAAPHDIAGGFYRSVESRRDRTRMLYQRIMKRSPSADELRAGARFLVRGDDVTLATKIVASADFYDLVTDS